MKTVQLVKLFAERATTAPGESAVVQQYSCFYCDTAVLQHDCRWHMSHQLLASNGLIFTVYRYRKVSREESDGNKL